MRLPIKLYQLKSKEVKVRGKDSRRHKNTPTKNKKGPIGVNYQKDKKVRERAAKRRTERLKLKVKELRVVTGKYAKLELFDEDENCKPFLSSRQVYATSTNIAGNIEPQNSPGSATSSGSNNQATAKRLAFLPSPSKKKIKSKSRAMDRNKCNICGALFNSRMDRELKSPWLDCDARGCQLLEKLIKSVLSRFR